MPTNPSPSFLPLTGLYEPSAIQQIPDGRFLVLEDEKEHSFSLVTLGIGGLVKQAPLSAGWFHGGDAIWNMEDLEGLAMDGRGYFYAMTSHSRDNQGEQKKSRDKLARFRLDDDKLVDAVVVGGLKRALAAAHPVLAAATESADAKSQGGLNMEALEVTPDGKQLLLGFRSPLQDGLALVACLDNPDAIFESGAAPQVSSTLHQLDLAGNGIRAMGFVPSLGGYLVISGPATPTGGGFALWFWSGASGAKARPVSIKGMPDLARAEGVCAASIDGVACIAIVSDEGDREEKQSARFALVDVTLIDIAA